MLRQQSTVLCAAFKARECVTAHAVARVAAQAMARSAPHIAAQRASSSNPSVPSLDRDDHTKVHFREIDIYHKRLRNPSDWTITGYSVGGLYTSLCITEPGIMVDCGKLITDVDGKPIVPPHLLVTHHHGDHVRNIGFYRKFNSNIVDAVSHHKYDLMHKEFRLDDTIGVRTLALDHTVQSVAYGIHTFKNGVEQPEVLVMGDTRINPFHEHSDIYKYPVVVVECTNYDPYKNKMYHDSGHISWQEILPVIQKNPQMHFHLIHPSQKMSYTELVKARKILIDDAGIKNAEIWAEPSPLRRFAGRMHLNHKILSA